MEGLHAVISSHFIGYSFLFPDPLEDRVSSVQHLQLEDQTEIDCVDGPAKHSPPYTLNPEIQQVSRLPSLGSELQLSYPTKKWGKLRRVCFVLFPHLIFSLVPLSCSRWAHRDPRNNSEKMATSSLEQALPDLALPGENNSEFPPPLT